MASFADISIRFTANLKQFSSQLQNANRDLKKVGRQMQRTGTALTVGLTAPIVALGVKSVIAFDKQAKAIAQVEAGIKSTGGAAGIASEQLQALASSLQGETLFGDEEILKDVTAQLLTFTNIAGEQFIRTQEAALDLATRLDGDLKSASIQLGKALNDPIANLSALSRSGIQFSNEQKAVIKSLVETNRLADAQTIILDELANQYGGAAKAAAAAGLGPFKQLQNSIGDLLEDFGAIISEALIPFIQKIRGLVDRLSALDPKMKKTIVVFGGLAAVIGPLVATLGFFISSILPALLTGFGALVGPIGLIAAGLSAIAVTVYKNWDAIVEKLRELRDTFKEIYDQSELVRISFNLVANVAVTLYAVFKNTFGKLLDIFGKFVVEFFNQLSNIGNIIKELIQGNFKNVQLLAKKAGIDIVNNLKGIWELLSQDNSDVKRNIDETVEGIGRIDTAAAKAASKGSGVGRLKAETVGMIKSFGAFRLSIQPVADALDVVREGAKKVAPYLGEAKIAAIQAAEQINERATVAIQAAAVGITAGFAEIIAGFALGAAGFSDLAKFILLTLADLIVRLGEIAIQAGIGLLAIETAFKFVTAAPALIAGAALIAFGSIIKGLIQSAPGEVAFADGGIVYGPTRALVGEYPGARSNPEVIAPLSKLKQMIGGGPTTVVVEGRISGRDILLSQQRTSGEKNRIG